MRKKQKKDFIIAILLFFGIWLFCPQQIKGEEYHFDGSSKEWEAILDQLPPELENELSLENPAEAADSLSEKIGITYWLGKIWDELSAILLPSLQTASVIIGMLILVSSLHLLSENIGGSSFGKMFELCCDICIASVIVSVAENLIGTASAYLDRLCGLMNVLIPVTEAVYLMEASISQLTVHKAAMLLYIGITSNLNNLVLKPLFGILFGFAVSGTVFQQFGLSGFIDGIKKFVMTVISVFTMVFSFILGLQTVLAKSADSLGLKTARLALGSFVPIVGGTLSEALTTVKEGFGVIRSVAGVGGIVVILLLILPTAVSLFTNNMILSFCHMAAEMMGCGNSARIIDGVKSVLSILCAIVYATTLLFIMAMIIFAKTGGAA